MPLTLTPEELALVRKITFREFGRRGGKAKTPKKARSSARNGKLGGRPRKHPIAA